MLAFTSLAVAYAAGPPDGRTGAPGEGNCTQCHSSFPLDSGDGGFELYTDDEAFYVPGEQYTMNIEVFDPQAQRWGFELTIIDTAGEVAGTLSPMDGDTQVSSSGGRDYGKHTTAGTHEGDTEWSYWFMSWVAPEASTGTVLIFGTANAANGNHSSSGDYIYSFALAIDEDTSSSVDPFASFAFLNPNYPNPFNPKTSIPFSLEQDSYVRLSIYNASGRLVTVLEDGPMGAGSHESNWTGKDSRGQSQPSGVYLARLTGQGGKDLAPARKMILSK
jgi:hypothetical protein